MDGYVVDGPTTSGASRRWTTRDFVAKDAEWTSNGTLTILGAASSGRNAPSSLYEASAGKNPLQLKRIARGILAMSQGPGGEGLVYAYVGGPRESGLALMRDGVIHRLFADHVEGRVAALSLSPDGREAVLAVRPPGDAEVSELRIFDTRTGEGREITRLGGKQEILGAPQWTKQGLYFVAGKEKASTDADGTDPLYDLYRAPTAGGEPEPAPGVGEDFVAASIRVSPDGERLAVIGRLNPKAPANVYVLDLRTEDLKTVTTNEDMEIKTGPDDLAWSPGGKSVAIVARGTPSTEPEVRAAPASSLLKDFYNLYEIPVEGNVLADEEIQW